MGVALRQTVGGGGDYLLDSFRLSHPHTPGHTRFAGKKSSPLDYVLLSSSLRHLLPISTTRVGASPLTSDHYPVEFFFSVTGFQAPVTIINGGLRMRELSTASREELHRELEATSDFAQRQGPKLNDLPAGDVFEEASTV